VLPTQGAASFVVDLDLAAAEVREDSAKRERDDERCDGILIGVRLPAYREHRGWFFVYFGAFFVSIGVTDALVDSGTGTAQWLMIAAGAFAAAGGFAALYRAGRAG
jgi:hypothetical protein